MERFLKRGILTQTFSLQRTTSQYVKKLIYSMQLLLSSLKEKKDETNAGNNIFSSM